MNNNVKFLKTEFNNIELLKMFEIEVINKKTNEIDFITFDLLINKNTLIAQHEGLNTKENKSKKIAFKKIVLDPFYSLDYHLQELFDICEDAILKSEFFTLPNY
jgi:hypothetical protein